jgi:hypothetical protein
MKAWRAIAALSVASVAWPGLAAAQSERPMALGFNVDLFPTVISAVNGKFGIAPQIWVGLEPVRLRLVGAHLEPPDALAFADSGFRHPTTTAFAAIVDYTTGPHFDGFWIGSGFEIWQQSIEHDGVVGTARWTSTVFTVGGGYIWRVWGNFFLDPWLAVHATMNPQTIELGAFSYKPSPVLADASLKVGWFADL